MPPALEPLSRAGSALSPLPRRPAPLVTSTAKIKLADCKDGARENAAVAVAVDADADDNYCNVWKWDDDGEAATAVGEAEAAAFVLPMLLFNPLLHLPLGTCVDMSSRSPPDNDEYYLNSKFRTTGGSSAEPAERVRAAPTASSTLPPQTGAFAERVSDREHDRRKRAAQERRFVTVLACQVGAEIPHYSRKCAVGSDGVSRPWCPMGYSYAAPLMPVTSTQAMNETVTFPQRLGEHDMSMHGFGQESESNSLTGNGAAAAAHDGDDARVGGEGDEIFVDEPDPNADSEDKNNTTTSSNNSNNNNKDNNNAVIQYPTNEQDWFPPRTQESAPDLSKRMREVLELLHAIAASDRSDPANQYRARNYQNAARKLRRMLFPIDSEAAIDALRARVSGFGPSIASTLKEILVKGFSSKAAAREADPHRNAMKELDAGVHGVGPATASRLVAAGLDTIAKLRLAVSRSQRECVRLGEAGKTESEAGLNRGRQKPPAWQSGGKHESDAKVKKQHGRGNIPIEGSGDRASLKAAANAAAMRSAVAGDLLPGLKGSRRDVISFIHGDASAAAESSRVTVGSGVVVGVGMVTHAQYEAYARLLDWHAPFALARWAKVRASGVMAVNDGTTTAAAVEASDANTASRGLKRNFAAPNTQMVQPVRRGYVARDDSGSDLEITDFGAPTRNTVTKERRNVGLTPFSPAVAEFLPLTVSPVSSVAAAAVAQANAAAVTTLAAMASVAAKDPDVKVDRGVRFYNVEVDYVLHAPPLSLDMQHFPRPSQLLAPSQTVGLAMADDKVLRIPRAEVAAIVERVRQCVRALCPRAVVVCCGSYRRGKQSSGDCDVLVTSPDWGDGPEGEAKRARCLTATLWLLQATNTPPAPDCRRCRCQNNPNGAAAAAAAAAATAERKAQVGARWAAGKGVSLHFERKGSDNAPAYANSSVACAADIAAALAYDARAQWPDALTAIAPDVKLTPSSPFGDAVSANSLPRRPAALAAATTAAATGDDDAGRCAQCNGILAVAESASAIAQRNVDGSAGEWIEAMPWVTAALQGAFPDPHRTCTAAAVARARALIAANRAAATTASTKGEQKEKHNCSREDTAAMWAGATESAEAERLTRSFSLSQSLSGNSPRFGFSPSNSSAAGDKSAAEELPPLWMLPSDADDSKDTTWMGFCRLPPWHPQASGVNRRLDLKFYAAPHFPCALLYFTGSDYFNRSMRHLAHLKGWSLSDSALRPAHREKRVAVSKGKAVFVREERDVFVALGLRYVSPTNRNTYDSDENKNATKGNKK